MNPPGPGRKLILNSVGVLVLVVGFAHFWVERSYLLDPDMRERHEETGRTEPYPSKGTTLYLTKTEHLLITSLNFGFVGLATVLMVTILTNKWSNPFKKGSR